EQVRQQVILELSEALGRTPTDEEIDDEVDKRLNALIEEAQPAFEANQLPDKLEAAVAQVLRFDLAPEELAELELAAVAVLDGKEITTRHNNDGTTATYYREHPDSNPADNLLSLPHYTPPYQPPQPARRRRR